MNDEMVVKETGEMVPADKASFDLLRSTICKDQTDDEIRLFVAFCKAKRLDPFSREVYAIKRQGRVTFQMSIDTMRSKAEESGQYSGQETFWCGPDGNWKDVWMSSDFPAAAKVLAYRKDCEKPFVGIAKWAEYKPEMDFMWKKMPSLMLAKVAEVLALRKAFPGKLGGIYTPEEMTQADGPERAAIRPPQALAKPAPQIPPPEPDIQPEPEMAEEVQAAPSEIEFPSEPPSEVRISRPTNEKRASEKQIAMLKARMSRCGVNPEMWGEFLWSKFKLLHTHELDWKQFKVMLDWVQSFEKMDR